MPAFNWRVRKLAQRIKAIASNAADWLDSASGSRMPRSSGRGVDFRLWSLCLPQVSLPAVLRRRPPPVRPLGLQHRGPPSARHQERPAGQTQRSGVAGHNHNLWSCAPEPPAVCLTNTHLGPSYTPNPQSTKIRILFFCFVLFFFTLAQLWRSGTELTVYCHPLLSGMMPCCFLHLWVLRLRTLRPAARTSSLPASGLARGESPPLLVQFIFGSFLAFPLLVSRRGLCFQTWPDRIQPEVVEFKRKS